MAGSTISSADLMAGLEKMSKAMVSAVEKAAGSGRATSPLPAGKYRHSFPWLAGSRQPTLVPLLGGFSVNKDIVLATVPEPEDSRSRAEFVGVTLSGLLRPLKPLSAVYQTECGGNCRI